MHFKVFFALHIEPYHFSFQAIQNLSTIYSTSIAKGQCLSVQICLCLSKVLLSKQDLKLHQKQYLQIKGQLRLWTDMEWWIAKATVFMGCTVCVDTYTVSIKNKDILEFSCDSMFLGLSLGRKIVSSNPPKALPICYGWLLMSSDKLKLWITG